VLDLRASVGEIDQMIGRLLGPRIEVKIVSDHGGGLILADPGHVDQIVMNLIVNARDAMPDGGKLVVEVYDRGGLRRSRSTALPGPYVCLSVSDTGCGMDAATQRRIFEPFFTTKPEGKGTGLGLATVYALVKQSGGFIAFESEVGRGTTFRVYFPRAVDGAALAKGNETQNVEIRGSGVVLVVDDEEGVRAMAAASLSDRGWHVREAAGGQEALRVAQAHDGPIAALVTDVMLADMDGRELASRYSLTRPESKVLLMSGYAESVVREGKVTSDAAFIAKPFTPRDLARKLQSVLAQVPAAT
jgi:two-component system cell cycle sensor histidine kinase/response regulator CckA